MSDCCECIPNSSIHFNNEPVPGIGRVGFAESTNKLCMNLAYFCENLLAPNTLCKLWRKLDKEEGGGYAMILEKPFMSWEVDRPNYPVHRFANCDFMFVVDIVDDHDKEAVNCVIKCPHDLLIDIIS